MKKIKVLVQGFTHIIGGRETYIYSQFECIDKIKFQYDFALTDNEEYNSSLLNEIKRIGGNYFLLTNNDLWRDFLIDHSDYDLLVLNILGPGEIFFDKAIRKYGQFKKIIIHSHIAEKNNSNMSNRIRQMLTIRQLNKKMRNLPIVYWACSEAAGKWLFGPKKKFEIIKNGIDVSKFEFNLNWRKIHRENLGIKKDDFVIGNVARLCDQKNHSFLMKVFCEAKKSIQDAKLILIGSFQDKKIYKEICDCISKNGLENSVFLLGERIDVNEFYSAMDVFLFPSKFEGFGIVAIEAQVSGLPVYFSNSIPSDANIIVQQNHVLPIDEDSILGWVQRLQNDVFRKKEFSFRYKGKDEIIKAGLDVHVETKRVESFFSKYING